MTNTGPHYRQNVSYNDFFVAKIDVDGHFVWAITGGGPELDRGEHVACDSAGNVFLTALIRATAGSFDGIKIVPNPPTIDFTLVVARLSERPPLEMARSAAGGQLSWPAKATSYVLEASSSPGGTNWETANLNSTTLGGKQTVTIDRPLEGARFFRLRKTQ